MEDLSKIVLEHRVFRGENHLNVNSYFQIASVISASCIASRVINGTFKVN